MPSRLQVRRRWKSTGSGIIFQKPSNPSDPPIFAIPSSPERRPRSLPILLAVGRLDRSKRTGPHAKRPDRNRAFRAVEGDGGQDSDEQRVKFSAVRCARESAITARVSRDAYRFLAGKTRCAIARPYGRLGVRERRRHGGRRVRDSISRDSISRDFRERGRTPFSPVHRFADATRSFTIYARVVTGCATFGVPESLRACHRRVGNFNF